MTCCHRPDCPDLHCPGRPDRPPHAAKLHTSNSDNSAAGHRTSNQKPARLYPDIDWFDELRYWALVAATTCAIAGVAALLVGYLIYR